MEYNCHSKLQSVFTTKAEVKVNVPIDDLLGMLPSELKDTLVQAFNEIRQRFRETHWEPSELNGGKLCETAYRVLEWRTSPSGNYTRLGQSISNFGVSVKRFENDTSLPDGIRFHIPDALQFLYNLRNKRGVGHIGGDVDPNRMDATCVVAVADWVMAELIRLLHIVPTSEAESAVEALTVKHVPLVWDVANAKRVLDTTLSYREQILILLHAAHPEPVLDRKLFEWVGYSQLSQFRKTVLERCHTDRLVEYDSQSGLVYLSPTGVGEAESVIRTSN